MQLSLLKALYTDKLTKLYRLSEAENIFYIVLYYLEKKSKTAVLLGQETMIGDTYVELLSNLIEGKPVQYVLGDAPFYGLDLYVDENVLIPRPETEELVHWILEDNPAFSGSVIDIGTGSGCIPLALKKHWPQARLSGCDISTEALAVAQRNGKEQKLEVTFFYKDILKEEIDTYDIIISNPPYIAKSEKDKMHKNVLDYEPLLALFVDDTDPLLFYKRILQLASKKKTTCYLETSEFYRNDLDTWLTQNEYNFEWKLDFQEKNRMLKVMFSTVIK
jgi:release factor glutamine methyltransferase